MSQCVDHSDPQHPPSSVGIPRHHEFDAAAFEKAVTDLLAACGIAPDAAHMGRTAHRVRELWQQRLLGGYDLDPASALGEGFADSRTDMVVIRGIAVHGVCPHHLVPFRGVAHVAYLPGGRLHGFGRIARMVDAIGHRFTYQEWMTRDIADALVAHGQAAGVPVSSRRNSFACCWAKTGAVTSASSRRRLPAVSRTRPSCATSFCTR